jgi:predicted adenylyl cyclase CyaB
MTPLASGVRRNLERKARHADLSAARDTALRLGARFLADERQTDTYFQVAQGRLKLREIEGQLAVLIAYDRPDAVEARLSRYYLVPVSDPASLKAALTATLDVRGIVHKRRSIYLWHNVRIHLDEVEGLGKFVEFEAVLSPTDDEATAHDRLEELGKELGLQEEDYFAPSYADLLGF